MPGDVLSMEGLGGTLVALWRITNVESDLSKWRKELMYRYAPANNIFIEKSRPL